MKRIFLWTMLLITSRAGAETAEAIVSRWKSCLLPIKCVSLTADCLITVKHGIDISLNPIKEKEDVKMNLLDNTYNYSRLYFIKQVLRKNTTSWDGNTYIQSDRVRCDAKDLSYESITEPGTVNIYNARYGSLPEISLLWLDLTSESYLDILVKSGDLSKFDSEKNEISIGDMITIHLEKDGKSIKAIDRYVCDAERMKSLFYTCEIVKSVVINDLTMPKNVVITNYLDNTIRRKTEYIITYDDTSFAPLASKNLRLEIPSGASVNDGITGAQYIKDGYAPKDETFSIQKLNEFIENAKKVNK